MTDARGDPRVLFVMNLVLSAVFSTVVVSGLALAGVRPFDWRVVAGGTVVLILLTHFVVSR